MRRRFLDGDNIPIIRSLCAAPFSFWKKLNPVLGMQSEVALVFRPLTNSVPPPIRAETGSKHTSPSTLIARGGRQNRPRWPRWSVIPSGLDCDSSRIQRAPRGPGHIFTYVSKDRSSIASRELKLLTKVMSFSESSDVSARALTT